MIILSLNQLFFCVVQIVEIVVPLMMLQVYGESRCCCRWSSALFNTFHELQEFCQAENTKSVTYRLFLH